MLCVWRGELVLRKGLRVLAAQPAPLGSPRRMLKPGQHLAPPRTRRSQDTLHAERLVHLRLTLLSLTPARGRYPHTHTLEGACAFGRVHVLASVLPLSPSCVAAHVCVCVRRALEWAGQ